MEPLIQYFDIVNRHAVSLKPKKPLLDWINALYPDMPEDGSETSGYLMKDQPTAETREKYFKNNFADVFESELNDRHTDENDWPQKRNWKLFNEWFEISHNRQVLDLEEGPIKKF